MLDYLSCISLLPHIALDTGRVDKHRREDPPNHRKVTGTLASLLQAGAEWEVLSFSRPLMAQLRKSIRMSVDKQIVQRAEDIQWKGLSDFNVSAEVLNMVKLPSNPCWLEWSPKEFNPTDHDRAGMLVHTDGDVLKVATAFVGHGEKAYWNCVRAELSPTDGLCVEWMWGGKHLLPQRHQVALERAAVIGLSIACRLLILLTARNAPLVRGPLEDFERLNKQRRKSGKAQLLSYHPVRWDLHRFERRAGRALSSEEKAEVAAHLCRGHMKIRRSGAFWWTPHWRATKGVYQPENGRDHDVRNGGSPAKL